jgi:cytolysin-activating lysine-acyltransferase
MNADPCNLGFRRVDDLGIFEQLGIVVSICVRSGAYLSWTIEAISRIFMPPISLGQCAVFADGSELSGFATWAFLDNESHNALFKHYEEPPEDRWNSGNVLWIMDLVSTHRQTTKIARNLQHHILRNVNCGSHAMALRRTADGTVRKTARFPLIRD